MFAEAIAMLQKARSLAKDVSFTTALLARNYFFSGNHGEAEKVLQELTGLAKRQYVAASHMALAYMAFGENDQAFDCLEKAYEDRDVPLLCLKVAAVYDLIRPDPRCAVLLNKMGLGSQSRGSQPSA